MWEMEGTRGMFTRIASYALEDSWEYYNFNITENVCEDSRECSRKFWKCPRRFRGMFEKIPGNVIKYSGECWRRFRETLLKIPGNVQEDSKESKFQFVL